MIVNKVRIQSTTYLLMFIFITLIIPLHLFPCFIAMFITYETVIYLTPLSEKLFGSNYARLIVVVVITIFVAVIATLCIISLVRLFNLDLQHRINLEVEINQIICNAKKHLPEFFLSFLPENAGDLKGQILSLIESNLPIIRNISRSFLHGLVMIFVGFIIGILISLSKPSSHSTYFLQQLEERLHHLSQAFHSIVFAQIKISLINTLLTSILVLGLLPLLNKRLPMSNVLILGTFLLGLVPIIGNIISNTMIIVSAMSISLNIGVIMVLYLILIHKLEYLLNAEIIGGCINAKSWELLLAMLVLAAAFGLEGAVAAPIYYAYLKTELREKKLI